jgi:uncharacterized Zn-binding protein involved in type VI secretion
MRVVRWTSAAALAAAVGLSTTPMVVAQQEAVVAHSVSISDDGSKLELELTNGQTITIELAHGQLRINGKAVGEYQEDSGLESSWRNLLSLSGALNSAEFVTALEGWQSEDLQGIGEDIGAALEASLGNLDVVIANAVTAAQAAAVQAQAAEVQAQVQSRQAELQEQAARTQQMAQVMQQYRMARAADQEFVIDLDRLMGDGGVIDRINELRQAYGNRAELTGIQVEHGRVHVGDLTVRRGQVLDGNLAVLSGDVSIYGTITGNLAAVNGDVILHANGRVEGDVVTLDGQVMRGGGYIGGRVRSVNGLGVAPRRARAAPPVPPAPAAPRLPIPVRVRQSSGIEGVGQNIATLLGFFVALACIGFGLNFFMPRQLEVVSGTVSDSFGKSFLAGLFAQPLLLPVAAMLIAGLAITVVGIPVAILVALALPLAVVGAAVTGYLAAAKSVGTSYLTRRMAHGHGVVVTPYRSTVIGLVGLLTVWVPAVLLSWIPLMGQLLMVLAFAATWVMATAGIGAAILSRAGLRATFSHPGRPPALTDEHYWPMDASNFTPARRGRRRP